jgi:RimJ/RimL family protein N-acetyltransferase
MIETERLLLRPWREEDRAPFWAMSQDREVMRYFPPTDRSTINGLIDRQIERQAEHGYCLWVAERKADGRFLGFCGMLPPHDPFTEIEIGWRLAHAAWGQGYAREGAQACLDWAWRKLRAETVIAVTVPANKRSWGLMIRLGMTRNPDEDFDHPHLPVGDPLRRHVLYRIANPSAAAAYGRSQQQTAPVTSALP